MKYRTIVADPPWPMPDSGARTGASPEWIHAVGHNVRIPYATMSLEAIEALPVRDLAESTCHLYLWTVNRYLEQTYAIARAWGFRPAQVLTWCKTPMGIGMGGTFTSTTEYVLFCRRGTLKAKTRVDSCWWQWPRGPHSAKPEAFLDMVEQVSPGPYLELFARRNRLGWDTWGNECMEHVSLETAI